MKSHLYAVPGVRAKADRDQVLSEIPYAIMKRSSVAAVVPRCTTGRSQAKLMAGMDRQYLKTRMTAWLRIQGYLVNRKRVQRLMRAMGLSDLPQPNTSLYTLTC